MCLKILCSGSPATKPAELPTSLIVPHFLIRLRSQILANPQASCVTTGFACRQDMVRSNALVVQLVGCCLAEERAWSAYLVSIRDTRILAQEYCSVVCHLRQRLAWILR